MDSLNKIHISMEPILEESEAWTENNVENNPQNHSHQTKEDTRSHKIREERQQLRQQQQQRQHQQQQQQQHDTARDAVIVERNDTKCVEKYQNHFSWLKDAKFLAELENDSVDSDIIEEELHALQEEELPAGSRQKVIKFLQSNPVQILLCVVVLLDAGIVIAQILLDLHSVREQLHHRKDEVSALLHYIRDIKEAELSSYNGSDVHHILHILKHTHHHSTSLPSSSHSSSSSGSSSQYMQALSSSDIDTGGGGGHDSNGTASNSSLHGGGMFVDTYVEQEEHDLMHEVAHGLHFASIALLGFLVIEDAVKIIAMGKLFFKHKIEIFDAIIIISSFIIDVVFLGGVTGEEGEKAAAVLVVLLLWRIARVVDGILITVKQRQEFRIRLQKRARRKAEKRIDNLEEEKHSKSRQIQALKDLCNRAGVREYDIDACTPKPPRRVSTTVCALSSVARLSISMTMSMSSGLFSLGDDDASATQTDKNNATTADDHAPVKPIPARTEIRSVYFKRDSSNTPDEGIYLDLYGNKKSGKSKSSPLLTLRRSAWDRSIDRDETSFNATDHDRPSGSGRSIGSPVRFFNRSPAKSSLRGSPSKGKKSSPAKGETSKPSYERPKFELSPPTSPVNSSGVEIVIEPGTDSSASMSPPVDPDTQNATCDYLSVDHAYSNDSNNSPASATASQVYLLSDEIER